MRLLALLISLIWVSLSHADLLVRAVRQPGPGSPGNQTFTATDFGGRTPKGAIFFASGGFNEDAVSTGNRFSVGATDCTNQWVTSYADQDGEGSDPLTVTRSFDGALVFIESTLAAPGLTIIANLVSCQSDSITLNFPVTVVPTSIITAVLFTGSSVSIHAGFNLISNSVPGDVDVTTPLFPVDLLLMSSGCFPLSDDSETGLRHSLGWARRSGSGVDHFVQSIASSDGNGLPSASTTSYDTTLGVNNSQYIGGTLTNCAQVSVQDFDNAGWTYHTVAKKSGNVGVSHFALGFTDGFDSDIRVVDLPTSGGAGSYSGIPFQPQAVFTMSTILTTPGFDESDAGSVGLGFGDELIIEGSISATSNDNVSPTDTGSVTSNSILYMLDDDPTLEYQQSLTGFGATDVNFFTGEAPPIAYKMGLITISSGAVAPSTRRRTVPIFMR